ncbi:MULTISPECIES: hypothetical protein [Aquimarina]|uniref:Fibronectin type III domain-containing protein n=1 Tax=Aquimarina algiphila TaxID=2047982 RepID=A0A554VHE6_9FLAO|nr:MULTISPECIES: hypothetical protein [Aquimarina]TSE06934.1 hypothetical protein FOF46_17840 [Aquimarina algiphila]
MKKIFIYIFSSIVLVACSSDDNPAPQPEPPVVVSPPTAASLVFPENNSLCTEAKNLTGNPGEANRTYTISFRWTGVVDNIYEISLTNEADNTVRNESITATTTDVVLDIDGIIPGAKYNWQVVASKSGTTETAESNEQTFTAAGIAEISFAPNPATANNPKQNAALAATTSVTLDWTGKDDDNDIREYDVYFGEDNPPATKIETTIDNTITTKDVTVASNKLYFWRIITRDEAGNESSSAIFKFAVQ